MNPLLQSKSWDGDVECAANGGALEARSATRPEKAASSPPHSKGRARRLGAGFTFVEILVTLAFLSIVLPAVMRGITLSLSAGQMARQRSQASNLAYTKLTELAVEGTWQTQELAGDFTPDYPEYRWTAEVAEWDGVLYELDVTVSWRQDGRLHEVTLSTLVSPGGTS